jgi:hypothetical protein
MQRATGKRTTVLEGMAKSAVGAGCVPRLRGSASPDMVGREPVWAPRQPGPDGEPTRTFAGESWRLKHCKRGTQRRRVV